MNGPQGDIEAERDGVARLALDLEKDEDRPLLELQGGQRTLDASKRFGRLRAAVRVGDHGRVGRQGVVVVVFAPPPQPAAGGRCDAQRDVGEPRRRAAAVGGEAAVAVGHEEDLLHQIIEIRRPHAEPRQKPRDERRMRDEQLFRPEVRRRRLRSTHAHR